MSSGAFQYARYVNDDGDDYRIRVQPETLALVIGGVANAGGTGTGATNGTVRTSQSKRAFGVKPRTVSFKFTGAIPDGYKGDPISNIPLLQEAIYDAATPLATGTYLGSAIEVLSRSPESSR